MIQKIQQLYKLMLNRKLRIIGLCVALMLFISCCGKEPVLDDRLNYNTDQLLAEDSSDVEGNALEAVNLVRVVDGDTIVVSSENGEEKVRLIGINTPESVHPDASKNTQDGENASDWLKSYLSNVDTLYLDYDVERADRYGRTLAYVWLRGDVDTASESDIDEYMLNSILIQSGYAEAVCYEPNHKYAEHFEILQGNS